MHAWGEPGLPDVFPGELQAEKSMKRIYRSILTAGFFFVFLASPSVRSATAVDVGIDNGGVRLKGKLFVAEGAGPFATVILLRGFPSSSDDVLGIGSKLAAAGFHALTFAYSGSQGSRGEASFWNAQRDIQGAFDFLHQPENAKRFQVDRGRMILGGWCYGGNMALAYAAGHPEVTTVFSIAGNDHGEFLREYARNPEFQKMVDAMSDSWIKPPHEVRFARGAMPKEIVAAGLDRLDPIFDLRASAPRLAGREILLVGGWDDRQVTIDQYVLPFYRALEKAGAKKVTITAFQDDHYFKNCREQLAAAIIDWLKMIQAIR
jgi:dienelactone hydrolase